jgi:regulator of ribonuclease activity B
VADSRDERYRELLAKQLAMNEQTWRILQGHGITPDSQVRLDFAYRAPNRAAAESLKGLLEDQTDYSVAVQSSGSLLRRDWTVAGSTQSTTISPEILNEWVDWMVTAGLERDCEFDGWGTEI